jgi:hypothetical protein
MREETNGIYSATGSVFYKDDRHLVGEAHPTMGGRFCGAVVFAGAVSTHEERRHTLCSSGLCPATYVHFSL